MRYCPGVHSTLKVNFSPKIKLNYGLSLRVLMDLTAYTLHERVTGWAVFSRRGYQTGPSYFRVVTFNG